VNTNLLHNIINVVIAVVGAAATFDFTQFVGTATSVKLMAGLALLKLVINAVRDGLAGMAKPQG
jgi:hypothetical protein